MEGQAPKHLGRVDLLHVPTKDGWLLLLDSSPWMPAAMDGPAGGFVCSPQSRRCNRSGHEDSPMLKQTNIAQNIKCTVHATYYYKMVETRHGWSREGGRDRTFVCGCKPICGLSCLP